MPVSLHSITSLEAEKTVEIGGHELHVLYHPFKISPLTMRHYDQLINEADVIEIEKYIIKTLAHIIASWDLSLDEEGTEIVPIEQDQLEHLPALLLQEIFKTIVNGLGQ